ncbi:MAG TPA: BatA domain-containing protein, partial [Gemmataceae bacterium]|nr:BatA domain-containing protein [Gemmataceae bacterium]
MSFVHTIPLAVVVGLPLIPVVLHLFARQRLRTVELPTFRFLLDSYVRQRRRTRLYDWLVAALRVMCVLGLVAVIARPVTDRG